MKVPEGKFPGKTKLKTVMLGEIATPKEHVGENQTDKKQCPSGNITG